MKIQNTITSLFTVTLLSISVGAQESTTLTEKQAAVATSPAPRWKTSLTSYYYDFQGTRSANENLYSFQNSVLNMQLFTVEYKLNPNWTLLVLAQYLDNYVETRFPRFNDVISKDRTKGMGDTLVSAVTPLSLGAEVFVFADMGVSLPTGSIDQKVQNSSNNLAYNMQNGSGTVDAVAGLTALWLANPIQIGTHAMAVVRTGESANHYHLGDLYKLDAWLDYPLATGLTPRIVAYYKDKEPIHGADPTLGRTEYTEYYYHSQINWDVSMAVKYSKSFGPVALAAEVGLPVAQDSRNFDNVVVSTQVFGDVSIMGNF